MKEQNRKIKNKLLRILPLILCVVTFLTGCVQYDVGVNFSGVNRGEIVQSIKLGERLKSFSNETLDAWLKSIEDRAKDLEGKVKKVSNEELIVTIPFNNGQELEAKYNQFFNPIKEQQSQNVANQDVNLPEFKSELQLKQANFLFWIRNHLIYDLDLRSLSLTSVNDNITVDLGSLLQLQFRLNTPSIAKSIIKGENDLIPEVQAKGKQLSWELRPGQFNHLEAIFWLPSPLGIGAFLIVLLVLAGTFVRYQILTNPSKSKSPQINQT